MLYQRPSSKIFTRNQILLAIIFFIIYLFCFSLIWNYSSSLTIANQEISDLRSKHKSIVVQQKIQEATLERKNEELTTKKQRIRKLESELASKSRMPSKMIGSEKLFKHRPKIQQYFYESQNNCSRPIADCKINPNGLLYQFHRVTVCLLTAHHQGYRVPFIYYPSYNFNHEDIFSPLSTCKQTVPSEYTISTSNLELPKTQYIEEFHLENELNPDMSLMSEYIGLIYDNLNDKTETLFQKMKKNSGIEGINNYFCIHVRRTDKRMEARYHKVAEYIDRIEAYITLHVPYLKELNIYIVTDDGGAVLNELANLTSSPSWIPKKNYFYNPESANIEEIKNRNQLYAPFIFDIQTCASSLFFVGTWSSQVSRFIGELKYFRDRINFGSAGLMYDDFWYAGPPSKYWQNNFKGIYLTDKEYEEINQFLTFHPENIQKDPNKDSPFNGVGWKAPIRKKPLAKANQN